MARLAKKKATAPAKKTTSSVLSSTATEKTAGLKASILSRQVNEFLHAPKTSKREKHAQAQERLVASAKVSAQAATSAKVSKKGEKQKQRRQQQAVAFNSKVMGLRDALPALDELQSQLETRAKKSEARVPSIKTRERVILHDKHVFNRNIGAESSAASPLARLGALRQKLAKSMGKDLPDSTMNDA